MCVRVCFFIKTFFAKSNNSLPHHLPNFAQIPSKKKKKKKANEKEKLVICNPTIYSYCHHFNEFKTIII